MAPAGRRPSDKAGRRRRTLLAQAPGTYPPITQVSSVRALAILLGQIGIVGSVAIQRAFWALQQSIRGCGAAEV